MNIIFFRTATFSGTLKMARWSLKGILFVAVSAGHFDQSRAAGQCHVKPYVHFSHVCTVDNYVPGAVDFCCCHVTNPDRLFCCRYHQDWYHFRCRESIDSISLRSVYGHRYHALSWPLHVVNKTSNFIGARLCAVVGRCGAVSSTLDIGSTEREFKSRVPIF